MQRDSLFNGKWSGQLLRKFAISTVQWVRSREVEIVLGCQLSQTRSHDCARMVRLVCPSGCEKEVTIESVDILTVPSSHGILLACSNLSILEATVILLKVLPR